MKTYKAVMLVLLLSNCSIKKNIIGKYYSGIHSVGIQLKEDSTFVYEHRNLHLYQYSKGKWRHEKNNQISLESNIKSTLIPLNVQNQNITNAKNELSIDLKIADGGKTSDYQCGIYIDNKLYTIKRCDSLSSVFINVPMNNFYFHFARDPQPDTTSYISQPVFTEKYQLMINQNNKARIDITLPDTYFYYKSFNGVVAKATGKSLRIFNFISNKKETIPKVSDEANIFSAFFNTLEKKRK
ncbi:hypothetical protein [Pararcticibacter amylolyticus]|uniref:Uncharacterized protein n=1 Tax=Pararcticibacter amylolyticus TaxID=2173175 RepID=A0A2U2PLH9_9SPHI|nr:hypothetical protein [Pararcticibacter amylolyticus]PWG82122.1 hypothetical protein DDR33_03650 [Pararcticibacter amylolyticus]